ncbi:hypothetical protein BN1708_020248 [Verticillium longisporum]|uniref:Uncharacterized protein n=1 Tax=Verticillium longisporum TaxID=100787 RepID=A0A0G4MT89_VERLO|nr:hypothetical protein BN1708_020248 [Verticillium longisporum]
MASRPTGG